MTTLLLIAAISILLALSIVVWAVCAISSRCSREEEIEAELRKAVEFELFGAPEGAQRAAE